MPTIINPDELEYRNDASALEQFDLLTLSPRLTRLAGSKHFAFDLRKLEPGKYSFPYHFHHNAEELILIISGSMTIRTPKGFEIAHKGQIVFFETGATSAHQFFNHEAVACEYLDIRTTVGTDVCEYPDSGKIYILPSGGIYEKESQVDYNKGEENVQFIWDKLKNNLIDP
jgi:uncharacterized cupin superfamily protein